MHERIGSRCIARRDTVSLMSIVSCIDDLEMSKGGTIHLTLSDSFARNSTYAAWTSPSPILPILIDGCESGWSVLYVWVLYCAKCEGE